MPEQLNEIDQRAFVCLMARKLQDRGSWCGETHLQKAVYVAKAMCGVGLHDFDLYLHGPYSSDLKFDLLRLRADGFFQPRFRASNYGPTLDVVDDAAENLMKRGADGRWDSAIDFVAEWLGDKGVAGLEKLATAYFLAKETPEAPADDVAARLHEIKPHIAPDAAHDAVVEVRGKEAEWRKKSAA